MEQRLENSTENKEQNRETIEFYIEKETDYPEFQFMLKQLDSKNYDVKVIVGPYPKHLPSIVRKNITEPSGHKKGPQEYCGESSAKEAMDLILKNSIQRR